MAQTSPANLMNLRAAPEGAIIVDGDGQFIAAKVDMIRDEGWYGWFFDGWVDEERIAYHQGGVDWIIIIADELED